MQIGVNYNISYKGRNTEIRSAQKVLHKIKSEYPASSPYIIDYLSRKHGISMSSHNYTNAKLYAFRVVQKMNMDSDLKYAKTILDVFKQSRAANCKEYSELAFIIATLNGFKDCHCVDFTKLLSDGTFTDIDHVVLLINQKVPKNKIKLPRCHDRDITQESAFLPSRKSIVVDPLFDIVDYWDNAVIKYKTIYPETSAKNLYVAARDSIMSDNADIQNIQNTYPELLIKQKKHIY